MPDEEQKQETTTTQTPFNLSATLATPEGKTAIDAYVAEETRGLRGALDEHKAFKAKYQISAEGDAVEYLDPEKAKMALKTSNGEDKNTSKPEGVTEEQIKKAVATALAKQESEKFKPLQCALEEEQAYTRRLLITNEVRDSLSKAGIHQHLMDGLMALWEQQNVFAVEVEGKNRVVVIRKADGETDYGSSGRKTIPEFVETFKTSEAGKSYFLASASTGGHTGTKTTDGSLAGLKRSAMSEDDRLAFLKEHSFEEYQKLPR